MLSTSKQSIVDLTEMKKHIINIFKECVKSVLPRNIIKNTLKFDSKTLYVNNNTFYVPRNVYIVGFGKAVLDMALEVEKILNGSVKEAIVSVPCGTKQDINSSKIRVLEAAKNNIPDQRAVENTNYIKNVISNLTDDDVLIVLISGGGSALLCSPTVPLSDKIFTINLLSSHGASIEQLNSVRKALSHVKGGKLINLVTNSTVISLILSDIVGDPLSAIASGPTVPNSDSNNLPMEIIKHFHLHDKIPSTVLRALEENKYLNNTEFRRVYNYIIGNNAIALHRGVQYTEHYYTPILLTKSLQGNVIQVSEFYSNLILFICKLYVNSEDVNNSLKKELTTSMYNIDNEIDLDFLTKKVVEASSNKRDLCILSGGEPTVTVQGCGLGGRNQELALRISISIDKDYDLLKLFDVMFFSGGTDGIDGPTDACGAFGYPGLVKLAHSKNLDPTLFIKNNDSYGFYSLFNNGEDLLKIGHTGTNVMDIHILTIKLK